MKFKQSQKFRVIVNGDISFYTTARAIRDGVGSNTNFNSALLEVFNFLEQDAPHLGIGLTSRGYAIQLNQL